MAIYFIERIPNLPQLNHEQFGFFRHLSQQGSEFCTGIAKFGTRHLSNPKKENRLLNE
ncbi:MAG TPA: hypothetical protein VGG14_14085 [Candidatus Sulfotelmatobacter sp.]